MPEDLLRMFLNDTARLTRAVLEQELVANDQALTSHLIENGEVRLYTAGSTVYERGDFARAVYFILYGALELSRDGNFLAEQPARKQIGTWPVLFSDPTYDVTARAATDSVVLLVSVEQFRQAGNRYPGLWERLARSQSERLRATNELFLPKNAKIQVLIGSTVEHLTIARALKHQILRANAALTVKVWTDVFPPGKTTLESLVAGLDDWDFAVFFWTADDERRSRGRVEQIPRDNIVFETGLCIGRLGRRRTIMAQPTQPDLATPSDLNGVTPLSYVESADEVVDEIVSIIRELGPRTRFAIE